MNRLIFRIIVSSALVASLQPTAVAAPEQVALVDIQSPKTLRNASEGVTGAFESGQGTLRGSPFSVVGTHIPADQDVIDDLRELNNIEPALIDAFEGGQRDIDSYVVVKARAVDLPFYRPYINDSPDNLEAAYQAVLAIIAERPEAASLVGRPRNGAMKLKLNPEITRDIARDGRVLGISRVPESYTQFVGNALEVSEFPALHAVGTNGQGRTVAVIDTKMQAGALGSVVIGEECFSVNSLCPNGLNRQSGAGAANRPLSNPVIPPDVHGTRVASIVASSMPGGSGAPSAKLILIAAPGVQDVFDALYWIATQPSIDVVAMSIGTQDVYSGTCDAIPGASSWLPPIQAARNAGKIVVSSAGNDDDRAKAVAPACLSTVIGVSAAWSCNYPDPIYGSTCVVGAMVDKFGNQPLVTPSVQMQAGRFQ